MKRSAHRLLFICVVEVKYKYSRKLCKRSTFKCRNGRYKKNQQQQQQQQQHANSNVTTSMNKQMCT